MITTNAKMNLDISNEDAKLVENNYIITCAHNLIKFSLEDKKMYHPSEDIF